MSRGKLRLVRMYRSIYIVRECTLAAPFKGSLGPTPPVGSLRSIMFAANGNEAFVFGVQAPPGSLPHTHAHLAPADVSERGASSVLVRHRHLQVWTEEYKQSED